MLAQSRKIRRKALGLFRGKGRVGEDARYIKETWLVSDFYELLIYTSTLLFHEMEYFLPSGMKAF